MDEKQIHKVTKSDRRAKPDSAKRASESGRSVLKSEEVPKPKRKSSARQYREWLNRHEITVDDFENLRGF
jgi:tRNA C32,U32 (ribose-2'-O)-methylase TrmJ